MIKKYTLFTQPACPKCPAARVFLGQSTLEGKEIDASTDEGFEAARRERILSTPTVIFYDEHGKEVCRGTGIGKIKECLNQ